MRSYHGIDLIFHVSQLMIASAVGLAAILSFALGDGAAIPGAIAGACLGLLLGVRGNEQSQVDLRGFPSLKV